MNDHDKIKVLIVDDSAVVRQMLTRIFESDPRIKVIGAASDPYFAANKIAREVPDVISLDVEMPRMDGLTFLKKIMSQHPIPVVIISSLTTQATETGIKALELGALDIITKPQINTKEFFEESKILICDAIKAAAKSRIGRKRVAAAISDIPQPAKKLSADAVLIKSSNYSMIKTTEKVVAIGASTGGTEAIRELLMALPENSPGIVIVQHMPELFTKSFAERLHGLCKINVKEAEQGDAIIPGRALIAPGNKHTLIRRSGARYYVEVTDGPLVNRHRPSVDVLFRSAAKYAGKNAVGIIMTGMGDDGARGLKEMQDAGAETAAQDEKSCVVFGMPKEAIKLNAANHILPLNRLANFLLSKAAAHA